MASNWYYYQLTLYTSLMWTHQDYTNWFCTKQTEYGYIYKWWWYIRHQWLWRAVLRGRLPMIDWVRGELLNGHLYSRHSCLQSFGRFTLCLARSFSLPVAASARSMLMTFAADATACSSLRMNEGIVWMGESVNETNGPVWSCNISTTNRIESN